MSLSTTIALHSLLLAHIPWAQMIHKFIIIIQDCYRGPSPRNRGALQQFNMQFMQSITSNCLFVVPLLASDNISKKKSIYIEYIAKWNLNKHKINETNNSDLLWHKHWQSNSEQWANIKSHQYFALFLLLYCHDLTL